MLILTDKGNLLSIGGIHMMHEGYMFNDNGMFNSMFIWIGLICLLMVTIIVVGIVLVIRTIANRNHNHYANHRHAQEESNDERAIGILKERLAKGEISHEEYDEFLLKIRNS